MRYQTSATIRIGAATIISDGPSPVMRSTTRTERDAETGGEHQQARDVEDDHWPLITRVRRRRPGADARSATPALHASDDWREGHDALALALPRRDLEAPAREHAERVGREIPRVESAAEDEMSQRGGAPGVEGRRVQQLAPLHRPAHHQRARRSHGRMDAGAQHATAPVDHQGPQGVAEHVRHGERQAATQPLERASPLAMAASASPRCVRRRSGIGVRAPSCARTTRESRRAQAR